MKPLWLTRPPYGPKEYPETRREFVTQDLMPLLRAAYYASYDPRIKRALQLVNWHVLGGAKLMYPRKED